jgi:hypothetical protein
MDVNESRAWTSNCADKSDSLSVDTDTSERLGRGLGFGRVIVLQRGSSTAAIFITPSESRARTAERELRKAVRQGAAQAGAQVSQATINRRIFRRSDEVFVYGQGTPSRPTRAFVRAIGQCVYEIRNNRWASFFGLDMKEIGRPFREK